MNFEKSSIESAKLEDSSAESKEENEFMERIGEIEGYVGLINAVGDELGKKAKLNALEIIKELKTTIDSEKRRELISDLNSSIGMINVWHADNIDKDAKIKTQDLIKKLK